MPPIGPTPPLIVNLLTVNSPEGRNYKDYMLDYNASLAFASRQAHYDVLPGRSPYYMRLHGQVHYHRGGLNPNYDQQQRKYAQLYILDARQALEQRLNVVYNRDHIDPSKQLN